MRGFRKFCGGVCFWGAMILYAFAVLGEQWWGTSFEERAMQGIIAACGFLIALHIGKD